MESMFSSRRSNKTARTGTRRSVAATSVYQATPFGTPPPGARQVMQKSVDTLPGSHLWVQPNGGSADPLRQGFGSSTCSGSSSWVLWRDSSDPGSLYPKYRRGRLCSALLAIAVVLVVLIVLAIAGLAVYMGALRIDSSNPELVFDGNLRVTEGDAFLPAMDNNASLIFREKALRYQAMIDRVYQHSQLRPAYKRSSIERFENGSLIVFFRIHLDRRKIPRSFLNVEETARDILIQELVSAKLGAFTGVKIDPTSINIKRLLEDDNTPEVSSRKQMFPPELTNNHIDEETTSTTIKTPPGVLKATAKVEDPTDQEDIPVIEGALVENVPESPPSNHLDHSSTTTVSTTTTKTTKKPNPVVQGSVVVTKLLEPSSTVFRTGSGVKKTSSGVQPNIEVDINKTKGKGTVNNNQKDIRQPAATEEAVTDTLFSEQVKPSTEKPTSATSLAPRIDAFTRFWATDGIRKNTGKDVIALTTASSTHYSTGRDDLEAVDTVGSALGEENLLKKVGSIKSESVPHQHIKNAGQGETQSIWNIGEISGSQTWTFSPPKLETDEPWRPIIPPTNHRYFDKDDDDADEGRPGVAEVVVIPPAEVLQESYSSRIGQPIAASGVEASDPDDKVSRVSLRVNGDDASAGAKDTSLLHATSGGGIIVRKHQPNSTAKPSQIVDPFTVPDQLPILHQFRDVDAILLPPSHKNSDMNNSTRGNTPLPGTVSPPVYHTTTTYHQTSHQPSSQNQNGFTNTKKPIQDAAHFNNNQPLRNKNQQHVAATSPQSILKNGSSLLYRNQYVPVGGSSQLKPKPASTDQTMRNNNRSSTGNIYRKPVQSEVTSPQNYPTSSWQNSNSNIPVLPSNVLSKKHHSSPVNYKQPLPERQQFSGTGEQVYFGTAEVIDSEGLGAVSPSTTGQLSENIPTRYGARPGWNEEYRLQDNKPSVTTTYTKPSVSDSTVRTTPFPVFTLIPVRSNSGVGRPLRPRPRPPQSTRYNDTSMSVVLNSQYHLRNGSQNKSSSSLVKSPLGDVIVGVKNNARPMPPAAATSPPPFTEITTSTDLQAHHYHYNSSMQVNRRITVRPPPSYHKPTTDGSVATPATWTKISVTSESVIEFDFPPSRSGNITDMHNNHDMLLMLTKKLPPTSKPTRHASPLSAVVVPSKKVPEHSSLSESAVSAQSDIPHDNRNRHDRDPVPKPINMNRTQSLRPNNATSEGKTTTNTNNLSTVSLSNATPTDTSTTPINSKISATAGAQPDKLLSSSNTTHHSVAESKDDQKAALQITTELSATQVHFEGRGNPFPAVNSTSSTRKDIKVGSSIKELSDSTTISAIPSLNTNTENTTTHVPPNLSTSGSTETTVSKSVTTEKMILTSPTTTISIILTTIASTTEKAIVSSPKATTSTILTTTAPTAEKAIVSSPKAVTSTILNTTAPTTEKDIVTSPKTATSTVVTTVSTTTIKFSDADAIQQKTNLNSTNTGINNNITSHTPANISAISQKENTTSPNDQLSLKTMKRKVSSNATAVKSNTTVKQDVNKHNTEQANLSINSSLTAHLDKKTDTTTATMPSSTAPNTATSASKSFMSTTAFPIILNTDVVTSTNIRISFGENGEQIGSSKLPTVQVQTPMNDVLNESVINTLSTSSPSEFTATPVSTSSLQTNATAFAAKNTSIQKAKESHRQPKMKPDDSYSVLMGRADFSTKYKSKTDEIGTTVATTLEEDILSTVLDSIFEESQNLIITTEDYREEAEFLTATTEITDTTLNIITPSSDEYKHSLSNSSETVNNLSISSVATNASQVEPNSTMDTDFHMPHLQMSHLENETSSQFTNYSISTVTSTSHSESLVAPVLSPDIFETDDDDDGTGDEYDISDYDILHLLYFHNQTKQPARNATAMTQEAVNALSKYAKVHTNPPPTTGTITPIEDDTKEGVTTESSPLSSWIMDIHATGTEEVKPSKPQHINHAAIPMLTKIYNKVPPTNPVASSGELSQQSNSVNGTGCPGNLTLKCGDGECISSLSRCNQLVDCNDGADERDCTCADYLRAQFLTRKLCDGVVDCWDFSDENNCEWCSPGQFVCPNSQVCVDQQRLCDGARDCPYGDDEKQCVTVAPSESTAGDLPYSSEGFLMVRKQGRWGKLCLQNFDNVVARSESSWEVADLGRAVCKAMTYSDYESVNRTVDVPGSSRADDSHYYELAYSQNSTPIATAAQARSSLMFQETQCSQKEVVKVSCKDLECGVRPQAVNQWARYRTSRIVGGGNAAPGSWPWQAALYKEGEFQCGATLIADRWLVSAGHCFYHALDDYWVARLGALRRGSSFPSPYEQLRPVSHIILHPGYVDAGFLNDISLLRLREPVQFSDFVRPVCLPPPPPAASIRDGRLCTVVGWGQLFEVGRIFPDTLQEVQLPIISTAECRKRTLFLPLYRVTDNMFCAGFDRGGRDACLGDSGGPLMCQEKDGRWSLYGVTSNGYGCARANRPGVYTKVANYVPWLQAAIAQQVTSLRDSKTQCKGHRCPLGECLPQTRVCNGFMECSDGSDEKGCW